RTAHRRAVHLRGGQGWLRAELRLRLRIENVRSASLVSRLVVLTSPTGRGEERSIGGIALLAPGVAAIMITADFPIARSVLVEKLDRLQPFRALPEIEMGHDDPHGAAMLGGDRFPPPAVREEGVLGREIFEREIGGVAVGGMQYDEARLLTRSASVQEIA